ncbi:nucleoside diphosphate-linked moiety X motif 8 [Drosophila pseudoobscura]|uniref:Nucleoside diphosphate-linked moiety X motif 8 n=1 Tax=Drosophila pseudoobscura pseudoobscura TaxID=46245 RepID=A0A6I8UG54_DROPS|nr:nucleoside diphosphate-linked moiety X motif 8 [Drosophila pseudoobscura]
MVFQLYCLHHFWFRDLNIIGFPFHLNLKDKNSMSLATVHSARQRMPLLLRTPMCHLSSSATVASQRTDPQVLSPDDYAALLSPEQQERCMKKMRNLPAFPRPKSLTPNMREKLSASVLIALCQERGTDEISLLYTRRSRHLRSHSFQISFPGGKRDESDASYVDCALRETEEEIGLSRDRIQVWGEAKPLYLPRTSAIVPVVGFVPDFHMSELRLNWEEVEEVFSIPLNALMAPKAARHTQFRSGYSGPVFVVDHYRIWGITGYLTHVFLHCLLPPSLLPESLKTNIKFVRPFKIPPKPGHHHSDPSMAS